MAWFYSALGGLLVRIEGRRILEPFYGRRLVHRQPVVVDGDDRILELGEVERLREERRGAQPVGPIDL